MNKLQSLRQSLSAAQARIAELEYVCRNCVKDINWYNRCIEHMIQGGSPCDWCDDLQECQLKAKDEGKGCLDWILRFRDSQAPLAALRRQAEDPAPVTTGQIAVADDPAPDGQEVTPE